MYRVSCLIGKVGNDSVEYRGSIDECREWLKEVMKKEYVECGFLCYGEDEVMYMWYRKGREGKMVWERWDRWLF